MKRKGTKLTEEVLHVAEKRLEDLESVEEKNKTIIDMFEDAGLYCSRVRLGLVILSDLQDDDYCELRAEL